MADVVRLTEWRARMPKRETVHPEAPARILLFTGVRYERAAATDGIVRKGAPLRQAAPSPV